MMRGNGRSRALLKLLSVVPVALLLLPVLPPALPPARAASLGSAFAPATAPQEPGSAAAAAAEGRRFVLKAQAGYLDTILGALRDLAPAGVELARQFKDYIVVNLPAAAGPLLDLVSSMPGIEWLEQDAVVQAASSPTDPDYSKQWNLSKIGMPAAWDAGGRTGSASVVVAVLDTGVAYRNASGFTQAPDLAGVHFLPGYDFYAEDLFPDDQNGHGTFVTEIIAAGWSNGVRGAGIASGCTILPLRVLGPDGSGSVADVAEAVTYAVQSGARVINMSLQASDASTGSQLLRDAVEYARSRGALCVAAAGNHDPGSSYTPGLGLPAAIPSVLSVGATDINDLRPAYSNYGDGLDMVAPGGDGEVDPTGIPQETFSTDRSPGSGFVLRWKAGTSFSSAQVTAVAALMLSKNPDLMGEQLYAMLISTCVPLGNPYEYGSGLLNAAAALQAVSGRSWYFAEGTTRDGFNEWLCLLNSSADTASATVSYYYPDGAVLDTAVNIAPYSRTTVFVNGVVGNGQDVSIRVATASPALVCERPMYFLYQGKWSGGSTVVGSPRRSHFWTFAEGYTGSGFEEWLCLQNPGSSTAVARVQYVFTNGRSFSRDYVLGPNSRNTLSVNREVGEGQEVSLLIDSDTPIVAERPMYFQYGAFVDGGHNVMGATYPSDTWYFAEGTTRDGFAEWLTLVNPGQISTQVTVDYMFGAGQGPAMSLNYTVGALSRVTIDVGRDAGTEKDVSCRIRSERPIVAERPQYFRYGAWDGGHAVVGANYLSKQWLFAEGTTRSGFEEWLTLGNPGATGATVSVYYVFGPGQGDMVYNDYYVPAESRYTVYVPRETGREKDVSLIVQSDIPIVAERPIYFSYGPWDGGHAVAGYPDW